MRAESGGPCGSPKPPRGALPAIPFCLLLLAVYADPILFRRNFAGRDLIAYNLPVERAIHDAYARGRLPVWMSDVSGGRPLLANPNAGALYPVRAGLAQLPFPLAMRIYPLLHWAAAGIGTMALLTAIGCSGAAVWVGAVTYVFSGVAVSEVFFPHIQPGMALLPWVLWALARPASGRVPGVLLLAALLGLDMLAGDVFTVSLALVCCVLWILFETARARWAASFTALGLSVLLGSLLALPQILATALWIPETDRAVLGMKLGEAFFFSVSPLRLVEFLVPFAFGATWELDPREVWATPVFGGKAMGIFTSLYAGAFAAIAAVAAWRVRARGARFSRGLLVLTLALAVLPSLVPAAWRALASPLPLRNPEKLVVGCVFALALLAARAFDAWSPRSGVRRGLIAAGALLALLALAARLWPDASAGSAGRRLPAALAEGGLLWMATVLALEARRGKTRRALLTSVLLLTAVPIMANRKIARTFREAEVFAPTAFARFLQRSDPAGSYRSLGESSYRPVSALQTARLGADPGYLRFSRSNWNHYTHGLWGRGTVFNEDFDAGDLSRVSTLRRFSWTTGRRADASALFGSLALRWGIRFRDQAPLPGYRPIGGDALQLWDEHERAFPDVRLLTSWREEEGPVSALKAIPGLAPGEAVLETGARGRAAAPSGSVRLLRRSPERLLLETRSAEAAWLFVLRGHWRHRRITLDGRPVEDVPAQFAFSALRVPAGRHTIDWREEVPGWDVSRWGPALFVLLALLLWLRHRGEAAPETGNA